MNIKKCNKVISLLTSITMLMVMVPYSTITANAAYENTHSNTGNQREDIVAVAETQIGYHEGSLEGTVSSSNNYTKYNVWNGTIDGTYKYALGGKDADLREFTKEMNQALGGRGGGKPFFVQGSVQADEETIRAFFEEHFGPAAR